MFSLSINTQDVNTKVAENASSRAWNGWVSDFSCLFNIAASKSSPTSKKSKDDDDSDEDETDDSNEDETDDSDEGEGLSPEEGDDDVS